MQRTVMILFLFSLPFFSIAQTENWRAKTEKATFIHRAIKEMTDVMVYDIYSPPVASRTYAYISVAAYETMIHADKKYLSLAGQLHGLTMPPQPDSTKPLSYTLAAAHAILLTGRNFVISEEKVNAFDTTLIKEFAAAGMPDDVMNNSLSYGAEMAQSIIAWAAKDKYKETRALPKFAVADEDPTTWKPTPPAYIKAIEPNWSKMRTFVIDSAAQFKPARPLSFSTAKNSAFYKSALAVYDVGVKQTTEENEIANFWDCNPFKVNVKGHVMYATKKISPNGHWMNITNLVCNKADADAVQSAAAYASVSIALADCFISCWDEKYRSNVIRPETFINQYIDVDWVPTLQTPPFPEYTSGHSVVSAAASVVLTKLFGDNFSFTDSTENEFDLPARSFTSFKQAANEAAISRFYGGIHYMPAINNGLTEGEQIGLFVAKKVKIKKDNIAFK